MRQCASWDRAHRRPGHRRHGRRPVSSARGHPTPDQCTKRRRRAVNREPVPARSQDRPPLESTTTLRVNRRNARGTDAMAHERPPVGILRGETQRHATSDRTRTNRLQNRSRTGGARADADNTNPDQLRSTPRRRKQDECTRSHALRAPPHSAGATSPPTQQSLGVFRKRRAHRIRDRHRRVHQPRRSRRRTPNRTHRLIHPRSHLELGTESKDHIRRQTQNTAGGAMDPSDDEQRGERIDQTSEHTSRQRRYVHGSTPNVSQPSRSGLQWERR